MSDKIHIIRLFGRNYERGIGWHFREGDILPGAEVVGIVKIETGEELAIGLFERVGGRIKYKGLEPAAVPDLVVRVKVDAQPRVPDNSARVQLAVAVIGVVGAVLVALINTFLVRSTPPTPPNAPGAAGPAAGSSHDSAIPTSTSNAGAVVKDTRSAEDARAPIAQAPTTSGTNEAPENSIGGQRSHSPPESERPAPPPPNPPVHPRCSWAVREVSLGPEYKRNRKCTAIAKSELMPTCNKHDCTKPERLNLGRVSVPGCPWATLACECSCQ